MKHAYLIIAHHEFSLLKLLLKALDDPRNDIYIHFDKKSKNIPLLKCEYSRLFILDKQVDIRWGHVSQIEAEYILFENAYNTKEKYSRYHLISGTHFPLKSQTEIHDFFRVYENEEILNFIYTNSYEVNMKLGRYHFFLKNYNNKNIAKKKLFQSLWHVLLKLEYLFKITKTEPKVTVKANNWVSLTPKAVVLIIQEKARILKEFKWTFCGDEYFVPYLLESNKSEYKMLNDKRLLYNEFLDSSPRILKDTDYDFLIHSDYLFARKFSESDLDVVKKILKHIKQES